MLTTVSSRRQCYAVLTVLIGCFGLSSVAHARDGLPPIHESSASAPVSNSAVRAVAPPPPVQAFSNRNQTVEQRLARLERLLENQALLEMLTRLEDLQVEAQTIRGELEVQRHEFAGIKQRQRDLYLDIDRRILQLEKSPATNPVASTAAPTVPAANTPVDVGGGALLSAPVMTGGSGQPAAVVATIDPLQEQSAYQQALNILREGRYDEAIVAFQSFLARFQGSQFGGNAQYWIAEANYVSHRYPIAVEEFQKVVTSYPDSSKVPDAMLKIGYTFYELKAWEQTHQTLSSLVKKFPRTTAAQLAENRLHRMKLEGR